MKDIELLTFRQMADACKVSRQTIYSILQQEEENPEYNSLVTVKGTVKHLTAKGQDFVREKLGVKPADEKTKTEEEKEATKTDAGEEYKDKYIKLLEDQLKIKDEQIRALNIAMEEMQQRQKEANILTALDKKNLTQPTNKDYIEPEEVQEEEEVEEFTPTGNNTPEEVKKEPRRGFKGLIDKLLGRN